MSLVWEGVDILENLNPEKKTAGVYLEVLNQYLWKRSLPNLSLPFYLQRAKYNTTLLTTSHELAIVQLCATAVHINFPSL